MSKRKTTHIEPPSESPLASMGTEKPNNILPSITVDCCIFGLSQKELQILLVKHAAGESKGKWAMPGGWVRTNESLEDAALRLLKDLTGLHSVYLEQLQTFSEVSRAGSERVITQAFSALVQPEHHELVLSASASDVRWFNVADIPNLIFDHEEILAFGINHLRRKIRYEPIGVNLLPDKFSLGQLQDLYEAILDKKLDKPNFRRKMLRMNFLERCNETQKEVPHRAGALYKFDPERYQRLCTQGFSFEF